eukprot:scaffold4082_cov62-Phaeocystis_antarctica.AAC.9
MARLGKPLPAGWGVDGEGQASSDAATDPNLNLNPNPNPGPNPIPSQVGGVGGLTPLGGLEETAGYKGYGLGI